MRSTVRQALSVALLASGLLVGAGCDSETVTGGAQAITVAVTPNPAPVGLRYEESSVIINSINVLPADPATAALYGTDQLVLFFEPIGVNLLTGQDEFISTNSLAPGTYDVKQFVITPLVLIDEDAPTTGDCIDQISVIDGTRPAGIPTSFTFTNPTSLTFTISSGQTKLSLKTNIPGLIEGYESSFTCTPGCGPGGSPCLTGFNQATYRAAVLDNMVFE